MRKIFFFRGLREEITSTSADEGRYFVDCKGEVSAGCKARLWGAKQLQAEQEGKGTMITQGHEARLWGTEEEGQGKHLWSHTGTAGIP